MDTEFLNMVVANLGKLTTLLVWLTILKTVLAMDIFLMEGHTGHSQDQISFSN